MDLRERIEALSEQNDLPAAHAIYPQDEEELKQRYLNLLEEGVPSPDAARQLGKTGVWFRARRSQKSIHYDESFADCYDEIMAPDGPHRASLVEALRASLIREALNGNTRAIEKGLMAWDPEFQFLRPAAFTGDTYNVDKLVQILPGIPTHLLEQMRDALVEKRKELPPGDDH